MIVANTIVYTFVVVATRSIAASAARSGGNRSGIIVVGIPIIPMGVPQLTMLTPLLSHMPAQGIHTLKVNKL